MHEGNCYLYFMRRNRGLIIISFSNLYYWGRGGEVVGLFFSSVYIFIVIHDENVNVRSISVSFNMMHASHIRMNFKTNLNRGVRTHFVSKLCKSQKHNRLVLILIITGCCIYRPDYIFVVSLLNKKNGIGLEIFQWPAVCVRIKIN